MVTAHWLPALLLLSAGESLHAAETGGNQRVCDEVQQRFTISRNQTDSRTLSFFLFDAAERGCMDLMQRFLDLGA